MLALFREISLRHWVRAPFRSGLVVLGIALGVALYVATGAASQSMFAAFNEFTSRVSTRADLSVASNSEGLPNALIGPLADVDGVAHVAASVEFSTQAPALGVSVMVLGVDLLGDMYFLPYENAGGEAQVVEDPLAFVNDPTAILVTEGFAEQHGLCRGDQVELLTSEGLKRFKIFGLLADAGPGAAFGNQVVVMFMDAAQVAFAKGHMADRIDVALEPGADPEGVRQALLDVVGPGFSVDTPEEMAGQLRQLARPLESALWLSGFMALLVGGFLVYNAVGVAVAQRRREIAMLRTFGITRATATRLFTWESALLAVPGVLLGLWIGHLLARFAAQQTLDTIDRMFFSMPKAVPRLSQRLVLEGVISGFFTAIVAGYFPARRGASIEPAVVLRQSGAAQPSASRRPSWYLVVFGVGITTCAFIPQLHATSAGAALGVAALMIGPALCTGAAILSLRRLLLPLVDRYVGVPGRLGLDYVSRSLSRSTVNVMALMVAVAMSVAVGGWLTSFERTIYQWADRVGVAELTVTQGSPLVDRRHVPFDDARLDRVVDLPGVSATEKFRIFNQEVLGSTIRVVATELETFRSQAERRGKGWSLLEGEPITAGELSDAAQVLLSENAAARLELGVGDSFTIAGPVEPLTVTVRAVIIDYTSESGTLFIDRRFYERGWQDPAVDALLVYLEPDANEEKTAAAIRRLLGAERGIFVTNSTAVRQQLVDTLRGTFSYSETIELVTLIIALMGIVGTMTAAIIDRTRELAMLRAIGATIRQVVLAIVSEAAFLGLCAALVGAVVGVLQTKFFLKTFLVQETGFHLEMAFPWVAALRVSGLVTLTSAAAGGLAAIRAARSDPAAALMRG